MRHWMLAASLVLVACGARSGLVPGVGGASSAGGGTPGAGGSGFGGSGFGGSSFGGTGGVVTGGSGFGGSGSGGVGFGGGGTTGFGGSPGSGGTGGTPGTCDPAFCPSDGVSTPCCMTAQGPCGIDLGNGCEEQGGMCIPPSPGATCDQVSSGNAACDACMYANCCDAISNCFTNPTCAAMAQCSIQHGCFGLPQGQLKGCLMTNCNATFSSIGPYWNAIACGRICCGSVCP